MKLDFKPVSPETASCQGPLRPPFAHLSETLWAASGFLSDSACWIFALLFSKCPDADPAGNTQPSAGHPSASQRSRSSLKTSGAIDNNRRAALDLPSTTWIMPPFPLKRGVFPAQPVSLAWTHACSAQLSYNVLPGLTASISVCKKLAFDDNPFALTLTFCQSELWCAFQFAPL